MNVLVFNCGSSTLKFQLMHVTDDAAAEVGDAVNTDQHCHVRSQVPMRQISEGIVDRIGGAKMSAVRFSAADGASLERSVADVDHASAAAMALKWLLSAHVLVEGELDAVGHRVVHGGDELVGPLLIDENVVESIRSLGRLAPLHNGPSLGAIASARAELGPDVPMVAVFDTDFHRTLPERSSRYPIPFALAEKHHIKRYGFHGIAHRYMVERYESIFSSTPKEKTKLITLQLGAGCSASAVDGGRSVDTSMGLTPLEGLMMATRSGDVDPSLAGYLAACERKSAEEVEGWLNSRSGLLGVSGLSKDMRELLEAEGRGDSRAAMAIEMYCYRVKKYIGAYLASLGGADAIIFGGGIGENAAAVRSRICNGLECFGLRIDERMNLATSHSERRVTTDESKLHAYVVPVDEGVIIAQDTASCLRRSRTNGG